MSAIEMPTPSSPAPFVDRRAGIEDRRNRGGRPPVTVRPLHDFTVPSGPPAKLAELELHTGYSRDKLITDIDLGYLAASKVRCGRRYEYRVAFVEAQRYLRAAGVLPLM